MRTRSGEVDAKRSGSKRKTSSSSNKANTIPQHKNKKARSKPVCEPSCDCETVVVGRTELLAVTRPAAREEHSSAICFVKKPTDLKKKIKSQEVQLAVWRRPPPAFVTALSDPTLEPEGLPEWIGMVTPGTVKTMKKELMAQEKRALSDDDIDDLVNEVQLLVSTFSMVSGSKSVFVKLEVVDDDGCAFWHQDCVDFRLVATYRGPCTECVHPDFSKATLRRRQYDSKHAQSLSHHDVALFKGRGETQEGDSLLNHPGVVHRSPRIEGSGIYRVVLVLDIPAAWHLEQME